MNTNFCIPDLMCRCSAENEKLCKYYNKSSTLDKCMWKSIKLGIGIYHCDNVDAQYDCRGTCNHKETIDETREGTIPT